MHPKNVELRRIIIGPINGRLLWKYDTKDEFFRGLIDVVAGK
jgi:hypothetical protein